MKRLHVDRRNNRSAATASPEYIGSSFQKQGLPRRDLVRVDVKMLSKLLPMVHGVASISLAGSRLVFSII
jgi:hypothetical protein